MRGIRNKYPNAGKAWDDDSIITLRKALRGGCSPEFITNALGRTFSACIARAVKCGIAHREKPASFSYTVNDLFIVRSDTGTFVYQKDTGPLGKWVMKEETVGPCKKPPTPGESREKRQEARRRRKAEYNAKRDALLWELLSRGANVVEMLDQLKLTQARSIFHRAHHVGFGYHDTSKNEFTFQVDGQSIWKYFVGDYFWNVELLNHCHPDFPSAGVEKPVTQHPLTGAPLCDSDHQLDALAHTMTGTLEFKGAQTGRFRQEASRHYRKTSHKPDIIIIDDVLNPPQENRPMKVTTPTLLNGLDVAEMDADICLAELAEIKERRKELKNLDVESKYIENQIADLDKARDVLVKRLDELA